MMTTSDRLYATTAPVSAFNLKIMAIRLDQANFNIQNDEMYFEELGKSYDSAFLKKKRQILIGRAKPVTAYQSLNKDILLYDYASDQNAFMRNVRASASGQGSFGFGKAKASGSYNKFFSSNSYSLYIFGFVRFNRDRYIFDVSESSLEPNFKKYLKKNYPKRKDLIEKEIGDEVITGVSTASEILVKIEIQTTSETEKEAIKTSASVKGTLGGSASASFSSITSKIKTSKKIIIDVYGNLPDGESIMENTSAAAVDKLILEYPKNSKSRFSIIEVITIPTRDLPQLIDYNSLLDAKELTERKHYCAELDARYQDFFDWKSDLEYINSNPKEFDEGIKKQALKDLDNCEEYLNKLQVLYENALDNWLETGKNGDYFKIESLKKFSEKTIPYYPRINPKVKDIIIRPNTPKKESNRHNGGYHGAGGQGPR